MSDWAGIAWLVVLLAANAFFVGAEFAVISARRSQVEPLAERGSRSAKTALYAMEHATLMLATLPARHHDLLPADPERVRARDPSPPRRAPRADGALRDRGRYRRIRRALLLVSYLHVVFGEMVPKNLAFSLPDRAVLMLAPPLVRCRRRSNP